MKPYHNKGLFKASLLIIFMLVPTPFIVGYVAWGDDWVKTYMTMFHDQSNCWENANHEMVCKETVTCKFGRNFCK